MILYTLIGIACISYAAYLKHKNKAGDNSPANIPEYTPIPYTEKEYDDNRRWYTEVELLTREIITLNNKSRALKMECNRVIQCDKDGKNPVYKYDGIKRNTMLDQALKCELKAVELMRKRDKIKDKIYIVMPEYE